MRAQEIENEAVVISGGDFQSKGFKIGDPRFVFDILSAKIYSNVIGAIVREITSNAIDANIESGSKQKIQITLPSSDNLVFVVRDYGIGIDEDRMDIFLSYAKSTKRDRADAIGYYGMGCKCPFAYSDSFYITSYIDGIKYEHMAYIDNNRDRFVTELMRSETSEPNGTEIKIFVKNIEDAHRFNAEFLSIWQLIIDRFDIISKTPFSFVKLQPINPINEFIKKRDCFFGNSTGLIFLNGTISYQIDKAYIFQLDSLYTQHLLKYYDFVNHNNLVIRFKIGELTLPVNRESFEVNEHNAKLIQSKVEGLIDEIKKNYINKLKDDNYYRRKLYIQKFKLFKGIISGIAHFCESYYIDYKTYTLYTDNLSSVKNKCFNFYERTKTTFYYYKGSIDCINKKIIRAMELNSIGICNVIAFDDQAQFELFISCCKNFPIVPLYAYEAVRETRAYSRKSYEEKFESAIRQDHIYEVSSYDFRYTPQTSSNIKSSDLLDVTKSFDYCILNRGQYNFEDDIDINLCMKNGCYAIYKGFANDTCKIIGFSKSISNLVPENWTAIETKFNQFLCDFNNPNLKQYIFEIYINTKFKVFEHLDTNVYNFLLTRILNNPYAKGKYRYSNKNSYTLSQYNYMFNFMKKYSSSFIKEMRNMVLFVRKFLKDICNNHIHLFLGTYSFPNVIKLKINQLIDTDFDIIKQKY